METKPEVTNVNIPSSTIPESIQTTIPISSKVKMLMLALPEPVSQWSIEKVGKWFESLSKEKGIGNADALKQNFIENGIDGHTLLTFNREDIKEMGISKLRDIKVLEEVISNLNQGIFRIQNLIYIRKPKQERGTTTKKEKEPESEAFKTGWGLIFHC
jgi:hypothetical protein